MKILLIGGAGYIGSHMYYYLIEKGCDVIILDDLSTGHASLVRSATLIKGDFADLNLLEDVLSDHSFDAVMHFAASSIVSESIQVPMKYYHNNVAKTLLLLTQLIKYKIRYFVFSSTAAVYGEPQESMIDINHPVKPINPYGMSKLMIERQLAYFAEQYDFKYSALRYFNAAGADLKKRCGELHEPETHLIPRILQSVRQNESLTINGEDYPTHDGTCIRDYLHVQDLVAAHFIALQELQKNTARQTYNLGTGKGYSVKEIIAAVERVTGKKVQTQIGVRRIGDPAILVAKPDPEFSWCCQYSDIDSIIESAWAWEQVKESF